MKYGQTIARLFSVSLLLLSGTCCHAQVWGDVASINGAGLILVGVPDGIVNNIDRLAIESSCFEIEAGVGAFLVDPASDPDGSGSLTHADMEILIVDIAGFPPGDFNLDGVTDADDIMFLFQHPEYEDGIPGNSHYLNGDYNGDREFSSSDLVAMFQDQIFP